MSDRTVITAVECVTPVGLDALSTVAAVRAGVSAVRLSEQFDDVYGEPILEGCMPWLPPNDEPSPLEEPDVDAEVDMEAAADEDEDPIVDEEPEPPPVVDEDEDDVYELARQTDEVERVTGAARDCLARLLQGYRTGGRMVGKADSLFLGVAPIDRPGPRFEGDDDGIARDLSELLRQSIGRVNLAVIKTGNAAAMEGVKRARNRLAQDPSSLHVIGALDSLVALETLNWYEDAARLKSGSSGRNHGIAPAEAVGFFTIETARSAQRARRPILAQIAGVGVAKEPNPFVSDRPSRGEGLTQACFAALDDAGMSAPDVGTVLCDLDGEFHRSKEWALAEIRCFGSGSVHDLVHPADCWGSLGAASSAVLIDVAAVGFSRGWFSHPVLVACSDDTGFCGAVVLVPAES